MGLFTDFSKRRSDVAEASVINAALTSQPGQSNAAALSEAAMHAVTSRVMIADANNIIVSINEAAMQMMHEAEDDLRQVLPDFSVATLVGTNIDIFHKNPAHQQAMLAKLTGTHETRISVGNRSFDLTATSVFSDNNVRLGTVVEWKDVTGQIHREELERVRVTEARRQAAVNARILTALDKVTSNVMVADADNIIVYANEAVLSMLRVAEPDLRKELPNFQTAKVVGSSVDIFHKNPQHQKSMLAHLTASHHARIEVGGRSFGLIASPVKDPDGVRLGTVVEWTDNTEEVKKFEALVSHAIGMATAGKLHERLETANLNGFMENFAVGFNNLMSVFENVINETAETLESLAAGKLTRKMSGSFEGRFAQLQESINFTIEKLLNVVGDISENAFQVKTGAGEIASGNASLSERTEEQAASLEETSAAMEQITSTVQQNASNSQQANMLARGAREAAENGGKVVGKAISAMEAISESSHKINDIIGVIDEIAFQTNLLALNAAVEAARAGDQGRGFAVVADEVRNLAGRSAVAAKEIKGLIKDSSERVKEGSTLVNQSGATLGDIVSAVLKVNDIVAEISGASEEQFSSLDEINRAIADIDANTQQNAALVEQAAAASESLGNQADDLEQLIGFFDTGRPKLSSPVKASTPGKPLSALKKTLKSPSLGATKLNQSVKPEVKKVPAPNIGSADTEWDEF